MLSNLSKSTPIFFPSTDKVFVGHKYPNEKTKLNPDSVHGKVKLECEKLIKDHTEVQFLKLKKVGYKTLIIPEIQNGQLMKLSVLNVSLRKK